MKKFNIVYRYWTEQVEVEDFEYAQDAVDKLIDQLEADGYYSCLVYPEEMKDLHEDEYVIGGNHGFGLLHNGNFFIEEVK